MPNSGENKKSKHQNENNATMLPLSSINQAND